MSDSRRLGELYQKAVARAGDSSATPHVSPEQLDALAAGRLRGPEALALLDQVMSDPHLQREFKLLQAVHAAGAPAARSARPRWISLAAAAAVLVIAVPLVWQVWDRAPIGDGAGITRGGASTVELVSPAADASVELPVALVWRSVPGALRYHVELLDEGGELLGAIVTQDSSIVLGMAEVGATTRLRWTVEAVTTEGTKRSRVSLLRIGAR